MHKLAALLGAGRNIDGQGGIRIEAVLFRDQIELHQIAALDSARAGDAVHGFVVHADTNIARESIYEGRGRAGAVFSQNTRADCIQVAGSHPWADLRCHSAQRTRHDASDGSQLFELGIGFDRHGFIVREGFVVQVKIGQVL